MAWEAWVLLTWLALECVREVLTTGRPMPAHTPLHSVANIACLVAFGYLVLRLGVGQ